MPACLGLGSVPELVGGSSGSSEVAPSRGAAEDNERPCMQVVAAWKEFGGSAVGRVATIVWGIAECVEGFDEGTESLLLLLLLLFLLFLGPSPFPLSDQRDILLVDLPPASVNGRAFRPAF